MWDWSNQPLQKKTACHTSLASVYGDINLDEHSQLPTSYHPCPHPSIPSDINELQYQIEPLLKKYNLENMQLLIKDYTPQTWEEMYSIFAEYQRTRSAFLKLIAYTNLKDLIRMGLDEDDISQLKNGITPENYNTHLKIPFDFGGNLNFNNFSFLRTHHTHSNIHRILDMQIANGFLLKYKKIFIPFFDGKFYYD